MTLEKLKQMLKDGAISQSEYDEMVEKLGLKEEKEDKGEGKEDKKDEIPENLKALIQSAVDRATNKLGNENKKLREKLEKLQKEKLSDDEIKKLDIEEREKALEEKEKELKAEKMRMFSIKALKDVGLDDGSDLAFSLADILSGDDEETITNKVNTFKSLVDKTVSSQVQQRFKDSGRDVKRGGSDDEGKEEEKEETSVAVQLGKQTAESNKAAQSVLDHYIGGNN